MRRRREITPDVTAANPASHNERIAERQTIHPSFSESGNRKKVTNSLPSRAGRPALRQERHGDQPIQKATVARIIRN